MKIAIGLAVGQDRRDQQRRSEAQCRIVEWVCNHPDGATCDEAAQAADVPRDGAGRVIRRLAAKQLVRCNGDARWTAEPVLREPPALITSADLLFRSA